MSDNINELKKLIKFYDDNKSEIKSKWNEETTKASLINKLFIYLGWDVNNENNRPDDFKDVVHEPILRAGSNAKAPDYSFKYGKNNILFFLEAKKPSIDIEHGTNPSFQLRSYGFSAKLPISILTNFENLAIYDCNIRPNEKDTALIGRNNLYNYKEYIDKWDEIYNFISKEAVTNGSLKIYETIKKKGTSSFDDYFLDSIEEWRKKLALNIASNNELSEEELNIAVQKTIDRIIFLRICEDRYIEPYENLKNTLSGKNFYKQLIKLFKAADDKYNSGLFHFSEEEERDEIPDNLTPGLIIDDKVLANIINDLYYPSPYKFNVISADVLGNIYERFLGKIITLKDGSTRAHVIAKPGINKETGVYYTPKYLVLL